MVTCLAVFQELRRGSVSVELAEESSHPLAPFVEQTKESVCSCKSGVSFPDEKRKKIRTIFRTRGWLGVWWGVGWRGGGGGGGGEV